MGIMLGLAEIDRVAGCQELGATFSGLEAGWSVFSSQLGPVMDCLLKGVLVQKLQKVEAVTDQFHSGFEVILDDQVQQFKQNVLLVVQFVLGTTE